jgi:glycosyltransferase Alg8
MLNILFHGAYLGVVVALVTAIPRHYVAHADTIMGTLFILGFLGTWRYGWAVTNFTRAAIYALWVYPRRKARAFARFAAEGVPAHAYFLVTTYMVEPQATIACYRALFAAAARARDGATVVVSVVDGADERLIRTLYDTSPHDMGRVQLVIDRIRSNGKRDALARSLRLIARMEPTRHDIVVFVDGDTCVPEDVVEQSAPMFTNPNLGALTTDEGVIIERENLFKDWFILRFNQRQVMMCSMGLANHVLTLTGRMSVFRGNLAVHPEFIDGIAHDSLDHWRLGRIAFLTGDDKSTWYWLLRNGYEMGYLPDVRSWSMETQPRPTFFDSSKTLMVRWFGNMMRTNGRALKLSPRLIGGFTWWSILDQRISMWTTLVGPLAVAMTAFFTTVTIIPLYIAWVMTTRYLFCGVISLFRGTWFPITHPFILYFGQVAGAIVKTYVIFRLDRQKWTRQGAGGGAGMTRAARLMAMESTLHHALAFGWLTIGVILLGQI